MDIQNEYEQELFFQIEIDGKKEKENNKQRKVFKLASKNLRKLAVDRLNGKVGEC